MTEWITDFLIFFAIVTVVIWFGCAFVGLYKWIKGEW